MSTETKLKSNMEIEASERLLYKLRGLDKQKLLFDF